MERSNQTMTIAQMLSSGLPMVNPISTKKRSELFKECCAFICPGFSVDATNKALMNEIFLYANRESKVYDSKKGLFLWGPYGTGKSTIIKILNCYSRFSQGCNIGGYPIGGFRIDSSSYVANAYATRGSQALELYTYNNNTPRTVSFDELGREPIPANHYGTELNVMQYIFQCRYDLREQCLTHATTNKPPEQIQRLYGSHIADRINEMFNVIKITGNSRR